MLTRALDKAWAEARIASAMERCGYRNVKVRWLPGLWFVAVYVTADHPERPYETTTGTSWTYQSHLWGLTIRRLVAQAHRIYDCVQ